MGIGSYLGRLNPTPNSPNITHLPKIRLPRLDRALATQHWCLRFSEVQVVHADHRHSDHRPIVVCCDHQSIRMGRTHRGNHFHFEASWLLEEDCAEVIQNTWTSAFLKQSMTVHEALQRTACELMDWNKNVLRDLLQYQIKNVQNELEFWRRN